MLVYIQLTKYKVPPFGTIFSIKYQTLALILLFFGIFDLTRN